jgi:DNA-binding IclR family transcriptional regulator
LTIRRDAKEEIIKTLRNHPEGLMLTEIANITGMNRFTVTKYVHELIGGGSIFQKEAAAAKICYLREKLLEQVREREIIEKLRKRM